MQAPVSLGKPAEIIAADGPQPKKNLGRPKGSKNKKKTEDKTSTINKTIKAKAQQEHGNDVTMKKAVLIAEQTTQKMKTPTTYKKSMKSEQSQYWTDACNKEIHPVKFLNV